MTTGFVKVGTTADVQPGLTKVYAVAGRQIAVCNVDGKFYAILDVCTHDGAPLDQGQLNGNEIECPRHGARFDVKTGRALCLPAVRPVPTYPVEVRDAELWIAVPAEVEGNR